MDSSLTFYLVLGALLLGFIVLGMLKGMIKMLLFGAAVLSSVAAYFWLSKYGFTLSLIHICTFRLQGCQHQGGGGPQVGGHDLSLIHISFVRRIPPLRKP